MVYIVPSGIEVPVGLRRLLPAEGWQYNIYVPCPWERGAKWDRPPINTVGSKYQNMNRGCQPDGAKVRADANSPSRGIRAVIRLVIVLTQWQHTPAKRKKNRHYRVAATRHFIFKRHEWRWRRDGVVTGLVLSAERNETIKKILSDGMGRYTLLVFTTGWNNIFMFSRRGRDDTQISCKTFSMAFSGAVPDNFGK